MHDLTNIQKTFDKLFLSRLNEKILLRNDIHKDEELIREELFDMKEIIEIPFGSIIYFLALEDEKPVLYVRVTSRMGSDDLYIIDGDSYACYDIYDGYPPEIKDKYFNYMKSIEKINNRFEFSKKIKNLKGE